jgi:ABC-type Fe3+ transport system permease subunit
MENNGNKLEDAVKSAVEHKVFNIIQDYWKAILAVIVLAVCAFAGFVLVYIRLIETSEIGLQGTATLDQWSVAWIVSFGIRLILWELLVVGLPTALILGVGGYLWWQRLPEEEKQRLKVKDKGAKSHTARNAGGGGFFMFIVYCIYLAIVGNYSTPFGNLPYSYWVYAYFWTCLSIFIIIGVPMITLGIVYFVVKSKKYKQ